MNITRQFPSWGRRSSSPRRSLHTIKKLIYIFIFAVSSIWFIISLRKQASFTIIVYLFTFNRQASFERLWNSIESSLPVECSVKFRVVWDLDNEMRPKDRNAFSQYLNALTSCHGPVSIQHPTHHVGLKNSILSAWNPIYDDEFAIFLEDDIEVSPYFLVFSQSAISTYRGKDSTGRLLGVSLFHELYNQVLGIPVQFATQGEPFVYQQPQSWGAVYFPAGWKRFLKFVESFPADQEPLIPYSLSNYWDYQKSWKKYAVSFMYHHDSYMVYTNFPHNLSLTANHAEVGTNFKKRPSQDDLLEKFAPPLVVKQAHPPAFLFDLPPLEHMHVYDLYYQRRRSTDDLSPLKTEVEKFVLITTFPRLHRYSQVRQDELVHAFQINLRLGLFSDILIIEELNPYITDKSLSFGQLLHSDELLDINYSLEKVEKQLSYRDLVFRANKLFPGRMVVIAHSDIYFDHSLRCAAAISQHPDAKMMLALSRQPTPFCPSSSSGGTRSGGEQFVQNLCEEYFNSHDAFIFKSPAEIPLNHLDFFPNSQGAENVFIETFKKAHYVVHNPCKDIHAFHYHCDSSERARSTERHLILERVNNATPFASVWTAELMAAPKRFLFCKFYY